MVGVAAKLGAVGGAAGGPAKRAEGPGGGGHGAVLQALGRQFAAFRQDGGRGRRVPEALRAAVAGAIREGVRADVVRRVCGLSWSQMQCWGGLTASGRRRASGRVGRAIATSREPSDAAGSRVRVFSVVDEGHAASRVTTAPRPPTPSPALPSPPRPKAESAALGEEALELRLGPWVVSVRLADGQARGASCCR